MPGMNIPMMDNPMQRIKTDFTKSDIFVAVFFSAADIFRVVDMNHTETIDADNPVK